MKRKQRHISTPLSNPAEHTAHTPHTHSHRHKKQNKNKNKSKKKNKKEGTCDVKSCFRTRVKAYCLFV